MLKIAYDNDQFGRPWYFSLAQPTVRASHCSPALKSIMIAANTHVIPAKMESKWFSLLDEGIFEIVAVVGWH